MNCTSVQQPCSTCEISLLRSLQSISEVSFHKKVGGVKRKTMSTSARFQMAKIAGLRSAILQLKKRFTVFTCNGMPKIGRPVLKWSMNVAHGWLVGPYCCRFICKRMTFRSEGSMLKRYRMLRLIGVGTAILWNPNDAPKHCDINVV